MKLLQGDCLEMIKTLDDNSVDSIVTDPPYELGFMGKKWDATGIAYNVDLWRECLRVLKPGGHLLAFSGSRTYHRMTCAIEDAGFEVRDQIMWVYGSGFPKSLDVSKAMQKNVYVAASDLYDVPSPADRWQGWGTALKPAHEPICVARKPLIGTVAENVLAHGTGALNIDGCRVETEGTWQPSTRKANESIGTFQTSERTTAQHSAGRWPANLIHDGLETEWSRFFYCAKASKKDRDAGLDGFEKTTKAGSGALRDGDRDTAPRANVHPTVKPTDLMRYLCRLVTPPNGVVLDPFMGSGSTGKAAALEGFEFIGIEREAEYLLIADARIKFVMHADNDNDDQQLPLAV